LLIVRSEVIERADVCAGGLEFVSEDLNPGYVPRKSVCMHGKLIHH
jgi:hypothetical protein